MRKHKHLRVQIKFAKKGRTKQWHKKECDINQIMQKYQKTGVIDHLNTHKEQYGFATSTDLKESLQMIQTANDMFADLPSKARTKFDNDPGQFLDFVQDPNNESELHNLGLSDIPYINPNETVENPVSTPAETPAET